MLLNLYLLRKKFRKNIENLKESQFNLKILSLFLINTVKRRIFLKK
jgi:hypothetical protein